MDEQDMMKRPLSTCSENHFKSALEYARGLSMKIGIAALTNGVAICTWYSGSSLASITASTYCDMSYRRSTTWAMPEVLTKLFSMYRSFHMMCVTAYCCS